jgi:hypothetical protein
MRSYAFASVVAGWSAALALSMVLVNFAFEAAGSVPDIEGCGFLAGSLLSLALIYPLMACAFGARLARILARKRVPASSIVRAGAALGALGSGLYFGAGSFAVLTGPHGTAVSSNLWALDAGFVLACALAGKLGASLRLMGSWMRLLGRTGN